MAAKLLPFVSSNHGAECPICTGDKNDNDLMVFVPGTFQRPAPTEPHYHLDCYITWAMKAWLDHLRGNSNLTEQTIRQYAHFVHCIWDARHPWTVEGLLDPNITPATVTKRKAKTPVSYSTCRGKAKPAWTGPWGFLTWLTNAPAIPDIYLKDKNATPEPQDLIPYWRRYLRTQTKLSVSSINRYLHDVSRYLAQPDPQMSGQGDSAWDGAFGFKTWLCDIQNQTKRDRASVWYLADMEPICDDKGNPLEEGKGDILEDANPPEVKDIIPEISEDPIPAGPTFEPRTIEITSGPRTFPDFIEEDTEHDHDFDLQMEDEVQKFNPGPTRLEPPVEDLLKTMGFRVKFDEYLGRKLLSGQIKTYEIMNPTDPQPQDNAELYMFRFLYSHYRSLSSAKKSA